MRAQSKKVIVTEVVADRPAAGKVAVGDQLVAVNGTVPADHHEAAQLLKSATGDVAITLASGRSYKEVTIVKAEQDSKVGVICASEVCDEVKVAAVRDGSAAFGKVAEGDILLFINQTATAGDTTAAAALIHAATGPFEVHVKRSDKLEHLTLKKGGADEDAGITFAQTDPRKPASAAPPGAPPGGHLVVEKYCGLMTTLFTVFLCVCAPACPCDEREVYVAPDGSRWTPNGARMESTTLHESPVPRETHWQ